MKCGAGQLEKELRSLEYRGEHKHNNFKMYIARHEKFTSRWSNCVRYFLGGIDKSFLKTAVQICESQDHYGIIFQNYASYLITMVQRTPAMK